MNYDKDLLLIIKEDAEKLGTLLDYGNTKDWDEYLSNTFGWQCNLAGQLIYFLVTQVGISWEEILEKLGTATSRVMFYDIDTPFDIVYPNAGIFGGVFKSSKIRSLEVNNNSFQYISDGAFMDCNELTTVKLASCEFIGKGAFLGCTNLETINFPDGLRLIDKSAFSLCDKLKSVELPKSIQYLGKNCFPEDTRITVRGLSARDQEIFLNSVRK